MAVSPATIPELGFAVEAAEPLEHAAVPTLRFALRIDSRDLRPISSILLDTQIQIAARRRPYDAAAHDRLFELFGPVANWGTSLRTLLWTRTTLVVPPFTGTTTVDLHVPCSYDLEVVASRYFDALADGEVPLEFLFSGTVFAGTPLQATRISWEEEAEYRLPVHVWKETMDRHFRGTAWLRLGKDAFDRLSAYKSRRALASWDEAVDGLLEGRE
ncbi:MAG TPA: DUF6084 family protein [Solirubrobacteraceae bacterium]|nr:DUF6084 family protein [Solirubrobacteraceae bacterium]